MSVSVHDIYSSAFYLALCFFVAVPSPFPSSEHHSASLRGRWWWWWCWCWWGAGGNLVELTNEASWDRQPTRGRMFHGDSGKGETEQKRVKPWRHFASTLRSSSPFHVTRRRDSSSFIDDEFDLKECFIINASITIYQEIPSRYIDINKASNVPLIKAIFKTQTSFLHPCVRKG